MAKELQLPPNATEAQLEAAYKNGLIRKENLVHGAYYRGQSKHATVARWSAHQNRFSYLKVKLGEKFVEPIWHPCDEKQYYAFLPLEQVEPTPDQRIPDEYLEKV